MRQSDHLFSLKVTVVIALCLIIPFLIRSSAPSLEPYPAVVLPLGIGLFDIQENEIDIETVLIWGKTEANEWERIQPKTFLDPIPSQYLYKIIDNDFGLQSTGQKTIKTAFWGEVNIPKKQISAQDVEETKKWLKEKLQSLGYQMDKFRVTQEVQVMDLNTEEIIDNYLVTDVTYELD